MFSQMPARIQQRLANALDHKCAPASDPGAGDHHAVVRTGLTGFACHSEGEGLDLTLILTCTIPWIAYGGRALITPNRLLAYGIYRLDLRVLVFGRQLHILAADVLEMKGSVMMPHQAIKALETHYLNVHYLWRELFD